MVFAEFTFLPSSLALLENINIKAISFPARTVGLFGVVFCFLFEGMADKRGGIIYILLNTLVSIQCPLGGKIPSISIFHGNQEFYSV